MDKKGQVVKWAGGEYALWIELHFSDSSVVSRYG